MSHTIKRTLSSYALAALCGLQAMAMGAGCEPPEYTEDGEEEATDMSRSNEDTNDNSNGDTGDETSNTPEPDGPECDPAISATCICTMSDTGAACTDPAEERCDCLEATSPSEYNEDHEVEPWDEEDYGGEFRYALIEDMSSDRSGEAPGVDIDAISVTVQGVERYATTVEDFALGGGSYLDPTEALGAPDSGCQPEHLVSLGGEGGYLIVSFDEDHVRFDAGDLITVYEMGPTTCPNQPQWTDDAYRVSVSNDLELFLEIGTGGAGVNTLVVP